MKRDAIERDAIERDAIERDAIERDAMRRDAKRRGLSSPPRHLRCHPWGGEELVTGG
jgi:hypothetical protein